MVPHLYEGLKLDKKGNEYNFYKLNIFFISILYFLKIIEIEVLLAIIISI